MSDDLEPLDPREARELFVSHHRGRGKTDSTLRSYHYRLKLFIEWCEEVGIDNLNDLSGRDIQRYEAHRQDEGLTTNSLKNELTTIRKYVGFCESIEGVEQGLADKIMVPTPSKHEQSNDEKLSVERAEEILEFLRSEEFGSRHHVLLELAWHTGMRLGGIRALDLRDYHSEEQYLDLRHRPETGTPLKNQQDGERLVNISERVCETIDEYIEENRPDRTDEYGRHPLVTTQKGRISTNTIRVEFYKFTRPCVFGPCPHDRDPEECEATTRKLAGRCPSSRSPHRIRTGSISHQLDEGIPLDVVSERVNATRDVIEQHYDKRSPRERMELRRDFVEVLE